MSNTAVRSQHHLSSFAATAIGSGFSLVELMVSITIGLVLMAGIIQLFANTSRSNDELAKANVQIENGRFAAQVLENDVMLAGFWDGYVPQFDDLTYTGVPADVPTYVPDPCKDFATWDNQYKTNLLGIYIQAYDYKSPASICSTLISNQKENTDILVVRHADTKYCQPDVAGSCTANELYVQNSFCNTTANTFKLSNSMAQLTLQNRDCASIARARKFISDIYYIRNYAVTAGDGIPTLVRSQFGYQNGSLVQKSVDALIENVESFRVDLGVDDVSDTGTNTVTDPDVTNHYDHAIKWLTQGVSVYNRGDGVPDNPYRRCPNTGCTVAQLANVVAVRLYLLVRSDVTTSGYTDKKSYSMGLAGTLPAFNDSYKRHVFSTTVRLANVSGRRETPP